MHESETEYTYYGADDDQEITVTVYYAFAAGSPERRYGHPDDWHDAEGPEVDLMRADWADGREMTKPEFAGLMEAYHDSIVEQIVKEENERQEDC